MSHLRRRVIAVLMLAPIMLLGLTEPAAAIGPCFDRCSKEVIADDDRFRGEAVLFVPGQGRFAGRGRQGGECPDCEWALVPACAQNKVHDPGRREAMCLGATTVCPEPGQVRFRLYLRRGPTDQWEMLGEPCLGKDQRPVTSGQLEQALRQPFEKLVPRQEPGFQPAGGALVHLPTIFYAGQPSATSGSMRVLGLDVRIEATPSWTWRFDAGVQHTTTRPGGPYPNKDVTHTYRTVGPREVVLVTEWQGRYELSGEGPYDIPEPVVQTSPPLVVPVYEARSQLVAGDRD